MWIAGGRWRDGLVEEELRRPVDFAEGLAATVVDEREGLREEDAADGRPRAESRSVESSGIVLDSDSPPREAGRACAEEVGCAAPTVAGGRSGLFISFRFTIFARAEAVDVVTRFCVLSGFCAARLDTVEGRTLAAAAPITLTTGEWTVNECTESDRLGVPTACF